MSYHTVKIILIATNAKKKNLVFVDDALRIYSLEKAIQLARDGLLKKIFVVNRSGNLYLRTEPNALTKDNLDQISISSYLLFSSVDDINRTLSIPAFENFWQKYQRTLNGKKSAYISIDDHLRISKEKAKAKLQSHRDFIFGAAKKFNIDSYLLAAIIIDEIARSSPLEGVLDLLGVYFIGKNTSAGIAQVKIETARGLIKTDYYNPNPDEFSPENIGKISQLQLYQYVKQPKHSIFFAAARIRALIDEWKKFVDLSKRPEIIATLYSRGWVKPHASPKSNDRGNQIAGEFYELAKKWLK